jgi:hypothetical protein
LLHARARQCVASGQAPGPAAASPAASRRGASTHKHTHAHTQTHSTHARLWRCSDHVRLRLRPPLRRRRRRRRRFELRNLTHAEVAEALRGVGVGGEQPLPDEARERHYSYITIPSLKYFALTAGPRFAAALMYHLSRGSGPRGLLGTACPYIWCGTGSALRLL